MEQDHSGSIPTLVKFSKRNMKVLNHALTRKTFKAFYGVDIDLEEIKEGID
ncbi:MAG TPA: FprA family A-type flavoprotein, partial [Thermofilum sp.]|nr:FprA family A-type flavoprotein [Thermofilum sp.]